MTNYYDNWQNNDYSCQNCNWQGKGEQYKQGEVHSDCFEICCPNCHEKIDIVMFPTVDESKQHYQRLSNLDKDLLMAIEKRQQEFKARKLTEIENLPELTADDIILIWDIEDGQKGGDTLIKYGREIIWREPAIYEGVERFAEVVQLLKQRYGNRLQDLVPTRKSRIYLYGDRLSAAERVESLRRELQAYK